MMFLGQCTCVDILTERWHLLTEKICEPVGAPQSTRQPSMVNGAGKQKKMVQVLLMV